MMPFYWECKLRIMSPHINGLAEATAMLGKFQNTSSLSISTPENVSLGANICQGTSTNKQFVIPLFINAGISVVHFTANDIDSDQQMPRVMALGLP